MHCIKFDVFMIRTCWKNTYHICADIVRLKPFYLAIFIENLRVASIFFFVISREQQCAGRLIKSDEMGFFLHIHFRLY